jgi:hypothetical protein
MQLEDTIQFWEEFAKIRVIDLQISNDGFSEEEKKRNVNVILGKLKSIQKQYNGELVDIEKKCVLGMIKKYAVSQYREPEEVAIPRVLSVEEIKILDTPLRELCLSESSIQNLELYLKMRTFRQNFYLGDIVQMKDKEPISKIRCFGKKSYEDLRNTVVKLGFEIGENIVYLPPEERNKDVPRELTETELKRLDMRIQTSYISGQLAGHLEAYGLSNNCKLIYLGDVIKVGEKKLYNVRNFANAFVHNFSLNSVRELKKIAAIEGFSLDENINYKRPEERKQNAQSVILQ